MNDRPQVNPAKRSAAEERAARLAQQLRDNLKRRKQQSRDRARRDEGDEPARD